MSEVYTPKVVEGAVASCLVLSSSDRAARVRHMAGDIVFVLGKAPYFHGVSVHPGV